MQLNFSIRRGPRFVSPAPAKQSVQFQFEEGSQVSHVEAKGTVGETITVKHLPRGNIRQKNRRKLKKNPSKEFNKQPGFFFIIQSNFGHKTYPKSKTTTNDFPPLL